MLTAYTDTHINIGMKGHETSAAKQWSPLTYWRTVARHDASQTAQCRKYKKTVCLNVYVCAHTGVDTLPNQSQEVRSYEPMKAKFDKAVEG